MPRWLHDLAPALAVAAAAALWHLAPGPGAVALSTALVAGCLVLGLWRAEAGPRAAWLVLLVGSAIAAMRWPGIDLWPCPITCAGAGAYRDIAGVAVTIYATVALALSAALGWTCRRARRAPAPLQACTWAIVGVAAYYLLLSARLHLLCGHCLAVHSAAFAAAALTVRGALTLRWRLALALIAALALHALYHHALLDDAPPPGARIYPPMAGTAANRVRQAAIDRARREGADDAPRVVELGIDFQCPRCAELHGPLLDTLRGDLDAGRVQLVTRVLVRASQPVAPQLARWALGAAALGAGQHRAFVAAMLGARAEADEAELVRRAAEIVDMGAVQDAVRRDGTEIAQLLMDDARRLSELTPRQRTPAVAVIDRASGRVLGRWDGEVPIDQVVAAIHAR